MITKITWVVSLLTIFYISSLSTMAEMTSENYRIRSYVLSSGGTPAGSANYSIKGTISQPSPLMDSIDPPFSDNYDLYPGFWYTLAFYEIPKRSKSLPLILLLLNE